MKFARRYISRLEDILLTFCWQKVAIHSYGRCYVLMYHHVTNDKIDTDPSCLCTVTDFRNTLVRMREAGYSFVSLNEVCDFVQHPKEQKLASVTFDDVPEDVYINAYPILSELEIPFTLFLTTKYIGKEGFLSSEQVVEMSRCPLCTIGAHTETHPMLRDVSNHYEEMSISKTSLENLIHKEVEFLAYPYGKHSSISIKVRREAKRIGFKCAFGTIEAPITKVSALWRFYLPRVISYK